MIISWDISVIGWIRPLIMDDGYEISLSFNHDFVALVRVAPRIYSRDCMLFFWYKKKKKKRSGFLFAFFSFLCFFINLFFSLFSLFFFIFFIYFFYFFINIFYFIFFFFGYFYFYIFFIYVFFYFFMLYSTIGVPDHMTVPDHRIPSEDDACFDMKLWTRTHTQAGFKENPVRTRMSWYRKDAGEQQVQQSDDQQQCIWGHRFNYVGLSKLFLVMLEAVP